MRRVAAILGALALVAVVALFAVGAGGDDEGEYRVRAIFDNAFAVIPGEDVKSAGVKIGRVRALDLTRDGKAAVVLDITDPGFQDFRSDARCSIRPQGLIGEKFIECTPTQPREPGAAAAPALRRIEAQDAEGQGQYLLPVERTSRPVDLDLLNNIMRLPYRQRLAIIINEFGTAVAGRGGELRRAIRRANPALQQTDEVLKLLAGQNRVLADLARDADASLGPLARERRSVQGFVEGAVTTARATAERRGALEANLERLPTFLRELRPTMRRLGALSDEMEPVLDDLGAAGPALGRFVAELGPFSEASTPALRTLGDASVTGRDALVKAQPLITQIRALGREGRPLGRNLAALLKSVRDTGGIEEAMSFIFYSTTAINGYDSVGHYLRAALLLGVCTDYTITPDRACSSNFGDADADAAGASAAREPAALRQATLAATGAAGGGSEPAAAQADSAAGAGAGSAGAASGGAASGGAGAVEGGSGGTDREAVEAAAQAGAERGAGETEAALLDYLLGDGS